MSATPIAIKEDTLFKNTFPVADTQSIRYLESPCPPMELNEKKGYLVLGLNPEVHLCVNSMKLWGYEPDMVEFLYVPEKELYGVFFEDWYDTSNFLMTMCNEDITGYTRVFVNGVVYCMDRQEEWALLLEADRNNLLAGNEYSAYAINY